MLDNITTDQGMYVHIKNYLDQAKNKTLQNDILNHYIGMLHLNA